MEITLAESNDDRAEAQALFSRIFVDIEDNAVPRVEHDYLYAPLVPLIRDKGGQVIAAAMTCRTQLAAAAIMAKKAGLPDKFGILPLLDKHSELDLLAVDRDHRGQEYGSSLVTYLEEHLARRGVRTWFGNVTVNLDADRLRGFYRSHGFKIVPDFQPLPPLLGRNWVMPSAAMPQFYFYKRPGTQPALMN